MAGPGPIRATRFVHAAIRRELDAIEAQTQVLDPVDLGHGRALAERLKAFEVLLHDHDGFEEACLFPEIEQRVLHLRAVYELEHRVADRTLAAMVAAAGQLAEGGTGAGQAAARAQLARNAIALNAMVGLHVEKENTLLVPIIEAHFTPEEQAAILGRYSSYVPPDRLLPGFYWIIDRLPLDDRVDFFRSYQQLLPPPAFSRLVDYLRECLGPEQWAPIAARVPDLPGS